MLEQSGNQMEILCHVDGIARIVQLSYRAVMGILQECNGS